MADDAKTYTEAEVQAAVEEKLAAAKAEQDTAFKELWNEAKAAKAKAKAFDGLDPEEARTLKTRIAELEQKEKAKKAGITSEELERLRAEVRADLEGAYKEHMTRAERLAAENRALKLDNVVKGVMSGQGVRADRIDALFKLAGDEFDLTDDGKPMLRDRPGTPVEKYVAEDLSKRYPEFFNGTGSSGGGASKSAGGAGGKIRSIAAGDMNALMANLEGVAKREIEVR